MNKIRFFLICVFLLLLSIPQEVFGEETTPVSINEQQAYQKALKMFEEVPGTYPITLKYLLDDEIVEKQVFITVKSEDTVVSDGMAIDAESIVVDRKEVALLTNTDWIHLSHARAWQTKDGSPLAITGVDSSQIEHQLGDYPLIFKTINQLEIEVTVSVREGNSSARTIYELNKEEELVEEKSQPVLTWETYDIQVKYILQGIFFLFLLFPLFILMSQYLYVGKLIKTTIKLLIKK